MSAEGASPVCRLSRASGGTVAGVSRAGRPGIVASVAFGGKARVLSHPWGMRILPVALCVALVAGAALSVRSTVPAATSCTGFGFQAGYGYGYGYDGQFGYGCPTTPTMQPHFDYVDEEGIEDGYCEAAADGGVFCFGDEFKGSMGGTKLNAPIVAIDSLPGQGLQGTPPPGPRGYYLFASDGGVFAFGAAKFYGSMGGRPLHSPIVGGRVAPYGSGYYLVAADGGVFAFGNAQFMGSMGGRTLRAPIVGMAIDNSRPGYWLVASDGGVFSFGRSAFYGSTGGTKINAPIVDIEAQMPSWPGGGYWMAAADGGVFAYGPEFLGSAAGTRLSKPIVGMRSTRTADGYILVGSDGGVYAYGTAKFYGSMGGRPLNSPIIGLKR